MMTLMRMSLVVAAVIANFASGLAKGEVRLPRLLSDGMVLQRDTGLVVWGWANPEERVSIQFLRARATALADKKGNWSVLMGPFSAGGPYRMDIEGSNRITVRDIYIGDVWLASGQSNMVYPVDSDGISVDNAEQEIATAHHPQIRLFVVNRTMSLQPSADVTSDGWRAVTSESIRRFSAIAYFFGRTLHKRYRVPIGLIESDLGGTFVEAWMSRSSLDRFPQFRPAITSLSFISEGAYEEYLSQRRTWQRQYLTQDEGRVGNRNLWAESTFDAHDWPTIELPRPYGARGQDFNGFAGIVWFRKELMIPPQLAGLDAVLQLGNQIGRAETYLNGSKIGETYGYDTPRSYSVQSRYLRAGRNVVVVRLQGIVYPLIGYTTHPDLAQVGVFGTENTMALKVGNHSFPLSGTWRYRAGPNLANFPVPAAMVRIGPYQLLGAPTMLFNAMVSPLTSYRIRGAIWYQGESNALDRRGVEYRDLFPALINDWRAHWGYPFPFLFVQLPGYGPNEPESSENHWAELREAQRMALSLPSTAMATTIDIGDESDIHPKNKQDVAYRLAIAAFDVAYGEDITASGPTYCSMRTESNGVRIRFMNVGSGLVVKGQKPIPAGFELAGADHTFYRARAVLDGQDIMVSSEAVSQPVVVRYAWSNTPEVNLFNKEGLPAVPFRTEIRESWKAECATHLSQ